MHFENKSLTFFCKQNKCLENEHKTSCQKVRNNYKPSFENSKLKVLCHPISRLMQNFHFYNTIQCTIRPKLFLSFSNDSGYLTNMRRITTYLHHRHCLGLKMNFGLNTQNLMILSIPCFAISCRKEH